MKKLGLIVISLCLLVGKVSASPDNFDIFGVEEQTKQQITTACAETISVYMDYITKLFSSSTAPSEQQLIHKKNLEQQIIKTAKKYGHFSEAVISSVSYPFEKEAFATLDLVKASDKHRLPEQSQALPKKTIRYKKEIKKLFTTWDSFINRKMDLMRKNQLDFSKLSCPVPHCAWGFDEQDLMETLPILQKGAVTYQTELEFIIKFDKNHQKRSDAVFILANHQDYQMLAEFLINFTDDPNDIVRNNVMRVLGAIAEKHQIKAIDINRILKALNYPNVTDRNKAAYVLLGIVSQNRATHQLVINQAGNTLIELLKLKQPNNHGFAYYILKTISQQKYGERDYEQWEKWIHSHQTAPASS